MSDEEPTQAQARCRAAAPPDTLSSQRCGDMELAFFRVFKKSAPNNKITLYLSSRDLIISEDNIEKLYGVLVVDPDYVQQRKVYGQVILTFRYGREDEEVMGLKFCNEAIMCLAQLYPPSLSTPETTTPLQDALLRRLGHNAFPFTMEMTAMAPPSVQLVPAKEYTGAPIGTSYDVRVYVAERPDEQLHRRSSVRMGIRVVQRASAASLPSEPPAADAQKPFFLLSDGRVQLRAALDRAHYSHGDEVRVHVHVHNDSSRTVRRIKVFAVQHVDVCMFTNGKFKNVVAMQNSGAECPLAPGSSLRRTYALRPAKSATKNWIALEDSFNRPGAALASTVMAAPSAPDDRNVFAIYVSYYVKVKLLLGTMGGELSLKLPFVLVRPCDEGQGAAAAAAGGAAAAASAAEVEDEQAEAGAAAAAGAAGAAAGGDAGSSGSRDEPEALQAADPP